MVIEILDGNEELPEAECSCRQTDVDQFDARGCELYDPRSPYRRQQLAEEWPEQPEPETSEECPY